ncbi:MAG: RHS repeat-associated core domain-containing protein [Thermodesulfobacteriota bacterium]|nr:RHS repeat-associated core domain-containing protein [Thermodesulfobacteriota bacterium]
MKRVISTLVILSLFCIIGEMVFANRGMAADSMSQYTLTSGNYQYTADWNAAVKAEFGPDAQVADFATIKANFTGRAAAFCDAIGLASFGGGALCVYNGSKFNGTYQGNQRYYYMERHNGNKPDHFLAHSNIDNYTLSLGSWFGSGTGKHIAVRLPPGLTLSAGCANPQEVPVPVDDSSFKVSHIKFSLDDSQESSVTIQDINFFYQGTAGVEELSQGELYLDTSCTGTGGISKIAEADFNNSIIYFTGLNREVEPGADLCFVLKYRWAANAQKCPCEKLGSNLSPENVTAYSGTDPVEVQGSSVSGSIVINSPQISAVGDIHIETHINKSMYLTVNSQELQDSTCHDYWRARYEVTKAPENSYPHFPNGTSGMDAFFGSGTGQAEAQFTAGDKEGVYEVTVTPVSADSNPYQCPAGGSVTPVIFTIDTSCYTLTLVADPEEYGSVTATPAKDCYEEGEQVQIRANPKYDEGYHFGGWSGSYSGMEKTAYITMDSDKNITAHFKPMPSSLTGNHGKLVDPVNTATGEYYFETLDINLGGIIPLSFSRYYGSALYKNKDIARDFSNILGDNWLHNYLIEIIPVGSSKKMVVYDGGKIINFQWLQGSGWNLGGNEEVPYQLRQGENGEYYLLDPSKDLIYIFDDSNRLSKIIDRNGNALTLTYDRGLKKVEDGMGRYLSFTYEGDQNRLISVSGPGKCLNFEYDNGGPHTAFIDPEGNKTTYLYENGNLISRVTLPEGNSPYVQEYDGEGRVSTQTNAFGQQTELAFEGADENVSVISYPDGTSMEHTHQNKSLLVGVKDQTGKQALMEYDENNRRNDVKDRMGASSNMTYHEPSGKISAATDTEGNTTTYSYSAQEQVFGVDAAFTFYPLTRIDYPDETKVEMTYDEKGNLLSFTGQSGNIWNYTYNNQGQVLTITNPTGGKKTLTYNPDDATLASMTDPETGTTTYAYDAQKRLSKVIHPDKTFIETTYDLNDHITSLTDEMKHTQNYVYNLNGTLKDVTDPYEGKFQYAYDLMDRMVKVTDPLNGELNTAYDSMGRLDSIVMADGISTNYEYDARGYLIAVLDGGGNSWTVQMDDEGIVKGTARHSGADFLAETNSMGRKVKTTDPLSNYATYVYDAMQRLKKATDPLGRVTQYVYDPQGDLKEVALPEVGNVTIDRNALGYITALTDLKGQKWTLQYSPLGRLVSHTDPLGQQRRYEYNNRGLISKMTLPDGAVQQNTYDDSGKLITQTYSDQTLFTFDYDALDRMVSTESLAIAYDAMGRVVGTTSGDAHFSAVYDKAGKLIQATYAGGLLTVDYGYDNRGILTTVGDSLGTEVAFLYNEDAQCVSINRSNGVDTVFTRDPAGRVTNIQHGSIAAFGYTLNKAGEIVSAAVDSIFDPSQYLEAGSKTLSFDNASQIAAAGYGYDPQGRLSHSPSHAFSWDDPGRLTGIDQYVMEYNGLNDLKGRSKGASKTGYYYNYAVGYHTVAAEKDETAGTWTRFYVWTPSGDLLYTVRVADQKVRFHHFDRNGNTVLTTDAQGNIADYYVYSPYGNILHHEGESDQPFTFAGRFGVMEIGDIYYMRTRYYDPGTVRFLSRDTEWLGSGNMLEVNPYLYAFNNPLSYVDSLGTWPNKKATIKVGKAIIDKLKPNKSQVINNVTKADYVAFVPGGTSYAAGDSWNKVAATAVKDVTIGGALDTISFAGDIVKNVCDAGNPDTHGVWSYRKVYEKYENKYKGDFIPGLGQLKEGSALLKIQATLNALTAYGRDAVSTTGEEVSKTAVKVTDATVKIGANLLNPTSATGEKYKGFGPTRAQ